MRCVPVSHVALVSRMQDLTLLYNTTLQISHCTALNTLRTPHYTPSGVIPESLGGLVSLQTIHLSHNQLTGTVCCVFVRVGVYCVRCCCFVLYSLLCVLFAPVD